MNRNRFLKSKESAWELVSDCREMSLEIRYRVVVIKLLKSAPPVYGEEFHRMNFNNRYLKRPCVDLTMIHGRSGIMHQDGITLSRLVAFQRS